MSVTGSVALQQSTLDTPVYEVANRLPYLRLHIQLASPMVIILLDRDRQISFNLLQSQSLTRPEADTFGFEFEKNFFSGL